MGNSELQSLIVRDSIGKMNVVALERNRQTILYSGLAIGVACVLVGILTAMVGG